MNAMKASMTPRERVEAVLSLDIPDRVPIGDGLFQHWDFIHNYYQTEQRGKWTLEEICRGVGNAKVDYAFDLAPSLVPHRVNRLSLTYISFFTTKNLTLFYRCDVIGNWVL